MKKRYITPEDYKELCEWWVAWGWQPFPQDGLPPTGIMIEKDGANLCAVWIYKTDANVCYVENYISDKSASGEDRNAALDMLMDAVAEEAKAMGFKFAMSGVKHNGLARRLEKHGFIRSDEGMTHYIRIL